MPRSSIPSYFPSVGARGVNVIPETSTPSNPSPLPPPPSPPPPIPPPPPRPGAPTTCTGRPRPPPAAPRGLRDQLRRAGGGGVGAGADILQVDQQDVQAVERRQAG